VPDHMSAVWPPKLTLVPERPVSVGQVPDAAGIFGMPLPITVELPLLAEPEPPPEPVLLPAVELPELLLPVPPPLLPEFDEPLPGWALDPDPPDPDFEPDPLAGWPVVLPVPADDDPLLVVVDEPPSVSVSIDDVTSPVAQLVAALKLTLARRSDSAFHRATLISRPSEIELQPITRQRGTLRKLHIESVRQSRECSSYVSLF
jgi:hypothetical protein